MLTFTSTSQIDRVISENEQAIADLRVEREKLLKKEEALAVARDQLMATLAEGDCELADLFAAESTEIRQWIVAQKGSDEGIWHNLRSHFKLHGDGEAPTKPKPKSKNQKSDHLRAGFYVNPWTQETAKKVTATPKIIKQWIAEHGEAAVDTWRA